MKEKQEKFNTDLARDCFDKAVGTGKGHGNSPQNQWIITAMYNYADARLSKVLPTDKEVEDWFYLNIGEGCSASSGIYKFRLWLKERNDKTEI